MAKVKSEKELELKNQTIEELAQQKKSRVTSTFSQAIAVSRVGLSKSNMKTLLDRAYERVSELAAEELSNPEKFQSAVEFVMSGAKFFGVKLDPAVAGLIVQAAYVVFKSKAGA